MPTSTLVFLLAFTTPCVTDDSAMSASDFEKFMLSLSSEPAKLKEAGSKNMEKYFVQRKNSLENQSFYFDAKRLAGRIDVKGDLTIIPTSRTHSDRIFYNILLYIGLPSIGPLLEILMLLDDTEENVKTILIVDCIVDIYDVGGEGKRMSKERISLFSKTLDFKNREKFARILKLKSLQ